MGKAVVLGVDVGGTNVKAGLVAGDGQVIASVKWRTNSEGGFSYFTKELKQNVETMASAHGLSWTDIRATGIGLPGFLDLNAATLIHAVNLHWSDDLPVIKLLQEELEMPIVMDNDGNLASLGEVWIGAGRGAKSGLCVTVGTGIGAGIVLGGQVYRGISTMAGEIGHLPMKVDGELCNCGHYGCLETLASATALVRAGIRIGLTSPTCGESKLTARDIFSLAKAGNNEAVRVVNEMVDWLARGLTTAAHLLNPEVIIIGGGVVQAGETFLKPLERLFKSYTLERVTEGCKLLPAELGADAGVLGAARLAWQNIAKESAIFT